MWESLVRTREGTFKPPTPMEKYLNKNWKHCLPKEEWETLCKEHPWLDLYSTVPPKVDKYLQEFLGKHMPKEHDIELSKIQSAILTSIRPLTSAWQCLTEEGLEEDPDMLVPGAEVLSLIQCTICLIGNALELTSQMQQVKILEAVDQSWEKFGLDRGRQGRSFYPYQCPNSRYMSSGTLSNSNRDQSVQKPRPLFHEPKLPPWKAQKGPQRQQQTF